MTAAVALSLRGRGSGSPSPDVGCLILADGRIVGRGWTQAGGRPHAEAMALAQAGSKARGATAYVTLEPCFHASSRGPRCVDQLIEAEVARVVIACTDPDQRTNGQSIAALRQAGIAVTTGLCADEAATAMDGFFARQQQGRPLVTLKLAMSLDGCIALSDGASQWVTGRPARDHGHVERSQHDAILVGGGTLRADSPRLDVRVAGLEPRSPRRIVLTRGTAPAGWEAISSAQDIAALDGVSRLLVEGGAATAAAFLHADLVDRLIVYHAPIIIGGGVPGVGAIGLHALADAHGCWQIEDERALGPDRLMIYRRSR